MYKTNGTTIISKSLHSCSDPAVGIHHTRLGNALLHIPQREYHQHMTRAPLTLGHLARCLPLQPLPTENACVHVHVSWTATFNTLRCPQTERNHRKRGSGRSKIWKKRVMGAREHACVKRLCHIWDEVIYGKVLCVKGHHPLFTLSSLSTSPSPQYSRLISVHFQEKTLGLTQLSAQHRSRQRCTS